MNYTEAQLKAYTDVEASIEAKIMTVKAQYQTALVSLKTELRNLYAELATINQQDWYNAVIKQDRLNALIRSFQLNYNKYDAIAGDIIEQTAAESMTSMYYRTQYINASFMPDAITLTVLPPNLVRACITGQAEAIKSITEDIIAKYGSLAEYVPSYGSLSGLLRDRNYEAISQIQQAVTQAIIRGRTITQLTDDVSSIFETVAYKAERIARTESLRASSAGQWAYTQELTAEGIETRKKWLCSLDDRTRSSHRHLDGKTIDVADKWHSGGGEALYPRGFHVAAEDINCRCTYVHVVNGVEPLTRMARNPTTGKKEVFSFKDYETWNNDNKLSEQTLADYSQSTTSSD